jgi:hypothetical protein
MAENRLAIALHVLVEADARSRLGQDHFERGFAAFKRITPPALVFDIVNSSECPGARFPMPQGLPRPEPPGERTPIMANKLRPKVLAICQDDGGKPTVPSAPEALSRHVPYFRCLENKAR